MIGERIIKAIFLAKFPTTLAPRRFSSTKLQIMVNMPPPFPSQKLTDSLSKTLKKYHR